MEINYFLKFEYKQFNQNMLILGIFFVNIINYKDIILK